MVNRALVAEYTPGLGWEDHGRLPDDIREYAQQIASVGEGAGGVAPHHETSGRSEPQPKKSHAQIKREVDEILAGRHDGTSSVPALPRERTTDVTWFRFVTPGSPAVTGVVQGSGGVIRYGQDESTRRLRRQTKLAKEGKPLDIYEPRRGHVRVFPHYDHGGGGGPRRRRSPSRDVQGCGYSRRPPPSLNHDSKHPKRGSRISPPSRSAAPRSAFARRRRSMKGSRPVTYSDLRWSW